MNTHMEILPTSLLQEYKNRFPKNFGERFVTLAESKQSTTTFDYYASASAIFSSKIEGEITEPEVYIKYKKLGEQPQPVYPQKIDDLYEAYIFAQDNNLDELGVNYAHALITKNILPETHQGKYRLNNMYLTDAAGQLDYVAAEPDKIFPKMAKLYHDIKTLLDEQLTIEEVFYYAAMIHLVFVKVHPYEDGNGLTARLVEKWFMAQKLGSTAWHIQSEKNYFDNRQLYFDAIRKLGIDFNDIDFGQSLPFALLLPESV